MACYRSRMRILTCVCFTGMSLLVILQELDRLDARASQDKSRTRHFQSHPRRNNLYDAAADSDIAYRVRVNDVDNVVENDVWNTYSSVLSAPKVIEKKRGNDPIRRKPLTNYGKGKKPNIGSAYQPQYVVILAQMRTGSSVVGQMLNQNKDFFYLYEPLHVAHDWESEGITKIETNPLMTSLLRNISQCEFSDEFVKSHGAWGGRTKSRALMPLCSQRDICTELSPLVYKQICLAYKGNVASKLIRANLMHLKPLMEESLVDVRVIHLVRDPRGTANSRLQYFLTKGKNDAIPQSLNESQNGSEPVASDRGVMLQDLIKTTHNFCSWVTTTLYTALSKPTWLRGHYMLMRYEDFAERPLTTAQEIYSFLGRPTPSEVLDWIKNNTQDKAEEKKSKHPLFSMTKNSTATASKWRLGLTREEILIIQDECSEAMRLLGYRKVGLHTPYTDLSLSLIKPINLHLP